MRVLVSGGAGRLGQYVVRELASDAEGRTPHEVVVLDRLAGPEQPRVRWLVGDVRDLGQVVEAAAGCQAIVHLAAVRRWGIAPDDVTFGTNVLGTFNAHEAASLLGIRRVVSTSSEAILGWDYRLHEFAPHYLPIDEEHPVAPQDSYGLSKEAGEAIARGYAARGDLVTVVFRPPWVALPEELAEVRRAGGRQPTRFGLYNYIDVRDLAEAYRLAVEPPLTGHHVLYVLADDTTVEEPLSALMPRFLPATAEMAQPFTGRQPAVSNRRVKELLGWHPRRSWREPDPTVAEDP